MQPSFSVCAVLWPHGCIRSGGCCWGPQVIENGPLKGSKTPPNGQNLPVLGSFTAIGAPITLEFTTTPDTPIEAPPGRMQTAIEADLARMADLDKGVRGSLAALVRELARAMDATGDDQPTPAQVGQLAQQLRTTLNALANVGGDAGAAAKFFEIMSTAVRSQVGDDFKPQARASVPVSGLPDDDE